MIPQLSNLTIVQITYLAIAFCLAMSVILTFWGLRLRKERLRRARSSTALIHDQDGQKAIVLIATDPVKARRELGRSFSIYWTHISVCGGCKLLYNQNKKK